MTGGNGDTALLAATRKKARNAAIGTAVVFATNGALNGSWVTRIPAVRDHVDASPAELGLALLCLGGGSLLTMPATGLLVRKLGSRALVTVTAVLSTAMFISAGVAPTIWGVAVALALAGLNWGVLDVAMNVQGHYVERALDRQLMPRFHASWSAGTIVGSAVGAVLARHHVPVGWHFTIAGVVMVVCCALAASRFLPDRGVEQTDGDEPHLPAWKVLDRRLLLIGVVTLCGTVAEGAAQDWIPLLFIDERAAGPGTAATAFTAYTIAMTVGRFIGTNTIEKLGRTWALRISGATATAGVVCTLAVPGLPAGLAGAALWGLGVSIVFPVTMSAAGDGSRRPSDAIAAVSTVGYGGFLLGPPMVGFLADAYGLGNALWVIAALATGIVLLAFTTRSPTREQAAGAPDPK